MQIPGTDLGLLTSLVADQEGLGHGRTRGNWQRERCTFPEWASPEIYFLRAGDKFQSVSNPGKGNSSSRSLTISKRDDLDPARAKNRLR